MKIKEIIDKISWESFLFSVKEKTFLQSWNWGEFQKKMGNKIWRLGVYDNEKLVSVVSVAKVKARRGTFLLIQHGPSTEGNVSIKYETLKVLLERLKKTRKEEKCDFIRIASIWERNPARIATQSVAGGEENSKVFKDLGFRRSPMHANAYEETWKLDITIPEEELFKNMRKTTRYLIRQAMKNYDITIEKSGNLSNIEIYQKLNKEVAKRRKFVPFSDEYIKNEFEIFSKDNQSLLIFGKYKEEIAAGALIIFWSGIGFYHQAASLSKYAKFSIPYLLQWEAIKEAKKRGCVFYDFWGYTDPYEFPKHPWAGPTLFKMGFGGYKKEYVKTQDFVLSNKYWLNWILETIRKKRRGF